MSILRAAALAALTSVLLTAPAPAATVHDETVNGDLSDTRAAPTVLNVLPGFNDVLGETGRPAGGAYDRDYFTFTIAQGYAFRSLVVVDSFISAGGGAFMGLQRGNQVTVDPDAPDAAPLIGFKIVSPADIGSDILPQIVLTGGSPAKLGAGSYSLWIQDGNVPPSRYALQIEVAAVPLPATAPLVASGLVLLGWRSWRRTGRVTVTRP